MALQKTVHLIKKTVHVSSRLGFYYIFLHILAIRQIDHPFIPHSFHWNTCLNSLILPVCTNPRISKPVGICRSLTLFALETQVYPLQQICHIEVFRAPEQKGIS
jgi:hypothetical protein